MEQLTTYLRQTDRAWRIVWLLLFATFIMLDAFFPGFFGITLLKLLGIALCFIYVLQKYNEDRRLLIAFGLTFIADILLAFNNASPFGIFCFIEAQFFHFSRLLPLKKNSTIIISIALAVVFVFSLLLERYAIFLLGAIYAFFLFSNIYLARKWQKSAKTASAKKSAFFAFYGFLLFAACDFCAALSFFTTLRTLPFFVKHFIDFLCWAFYYPSQVLISNSGKRTK